MRLSFDRQRLIYVIRRLGFWAEADACHVAGELVEKPCYHDQARHLAVGKLLVAANLPPEATIPAFLRISLLEIEDFILRRIDRYSQKNADRLRFPSELMQYIAWSRENGGLRCLKLEHR